MSTLDFRQQDAVRKITFQIKPGSANRRMILDQPIRVTENVMVDYQCSRPSHRHQLSNLSRSPTRRMRLRLADTATRENVRTGSCSTEF
jgi:hypothetical protein